MQRPPFQGVWPSISATELPLWPYPPAKSTRFIEWPFNVLSAFSIWLEKALQSLEKGPAPPLRKDQQLPLVYTIALGALFPPICKEHLVSRPGSMNACYILLPRLSLLRYREEIRPMGVQLDTLHYLYKAFPLVH